MWFFLFYSPKPGSQVRILLYRNWCTRVYGVVMSTMRRICLEMVAIPTLSFSHPAEGRRKVGSQTTQTTCTTSITKSQWGSRPLRKRALRGPKICLGMTYLIVLRQLLVSRSGRHQFHMSNVCYVQRGPINSRNWKQQNSNHVKWKFHFIAGKHCLMLSI